MKAADLKKRLDSGSPTRLLDVRTAWEFAGGHIPGSKLVTPAQMALEVQSLKPNERAVIVCLSGHRAVDAVRQAGNPKNVDVLEGGMGAWRHLHGEVERAPVDQRKVERQVRATLGVVILSSIGASLAFGPGWLVPPAIIGCGLLVAALRGTCPMESMFAGLPWSRCTTGSCESNSQSAA